MLSLSKQAKALGNARDMLTWGGYTGRPGYSMSKGLTPALAAGASVAHVLDVVKTERSTNVRL